VSTQLKKLSVHKFASCDGCQLSLLDLEDELLALTDAIDVAYFREATRNASPGPYDIALVEGSITTPHDLERIQKVRAESALLITIGACATAGGIQALRNFASLSEYSASVYPSPEFLSALPRSSPIAEHVKVDYELHGCPVNKHQLLEVLLAFARGRTPDLPGYSVCIECKLRGNMCVAVLGTPCLGPITHAGCGALCPTYTRGCYGCFGPADTAAPDAFARAGARHLIPASALLGPLRSFNVAAPEFRATAALIEQAHQESLPGLLAEQDPT
jgi:sulfhydrogenase subunit delta